MKGAVDAVEADVLLCVEDLLAPAQELQLLQKRLRYSGREREMARGRKTVRERERERERERGERGEREREKERERREHQKEKKTARQEVGARDFYQFAQLFGLRISQPIRDGHLRFSL